MLLEELKTFCAETSIHGLTQVVDVRASVLKRFLWLGIFVGSLCFAGEQLVISLKGMPDFKGHASSAFYTPL